MTEPASLARMLHVELSARRVKKSGRLDLTRRACLVGLCAAASPSRADRGTVLPHAANRFVDSVGVGTHLESAPYAQSFDVVLRRVISLGVRHIRDELRPTNDVARWRRLYDEAGIRLHLLVSPATNTIQEMMDVLAELRPEAISAVEGQNEGDSAWFQTQAVAQPSWSEAVVRYQKAVFNAVRAHDQFASISIVSPTVLDYEPGDMRLLQAAAPFCETVALHAYLQGHQEPETDDDFASIDWYLRAMQAPFKPQAPTMVTETGYPTGAAGISSLAAAIYLPRLLLHLFDRGIARTFLYELMDEGVASDDPEQNYGLLTAEAAPKPAFHALQLLLGALADPNVTPDFDPRPTALSIVQGPPDLRLIAFQKRSGDVVIALWRATRVWDAIAKRDVVVPPASARIVVPPGYRAATLVLSEGGTWSEASVRDRQIELELSGTACLVRLSE